jgi:hypothetical protein
MKELNVICVIKQKRKESLNYPIGKALNKKNGYLRTFHKISVAERWLKKQLETNKLYPTSTDYKIFEYNHKEFNPNGISILRSK